MKLRSSKTSRTYDVYINDPYSDIQDERIEAYWENKRIWNIERLGELFTRAEKLFNGFKSPFSNKNLPANIIEKLHKKYKRVYYEQAYLVRTNKRITTYFKYRLFHTKEKYKCPYCSSKNFPKKVIDNMDHMERIRCECCETMLYKITKYKEIYKPGAPTNLMSKFDIKQMEKLIDEKQSLF